MWLALAILALALAGLVVGTTLNVAAAFLALPITLALVAAGVAVWSARRVRAGAPKRIGAPDGPIEFTERDRRTLYTREERESAPER